ncbi:MAG TPA: hypothetical protein VIE88_07050 [Vicinamibacteria bacterium]|jgi:hypothetical protein
MKEERRSAKEIRNSLWETRQRLDRDLEELDIRLHENLSPKAIFSRHPALIGVAGAVIGYLLISRPSMIARGIARAAQVSAPLLARALLKKI